ncbi:hypothetical protein GJ496_007291 [Pomphorhynchus laevis]|nr:hypothetical protein GJ496_007291 [Pomphorhynchus laevis]
MQNYDNIHDQNSYMYQSSEDESISSGNIQTRSRGNCISSNSSERFPSLEVGSYDDLNSNFLKCMSRLKHLEVDNHVLAKNMEESRMDWDDDISRMSREKTVEFDACRQALHENYIVICEIKGQITKTYLSCERIQNSLDFETQANDSSIKKINSMSKFNSSLMEEIDQLNSNISQKQDEVIALKDEYSKNNNQLEEIETEFAECNCKRNYLEIELQVLKNIIQCMVAVFNVKSTEYDNVLGCLLEPTQFFRSELTRAISKTRRDFAKLDQLQLLEMESYYKASLLETQQSLDSNTRRIEEFHNNNANDDGENHDALEISNLMENVKHLNEIRIELERDKIKLTSFECKLQNQIKQNASMRKSNDEHYSLQMNTLRQQIDDIKLEISSLRGDNVSLKMELNVCKTLQQQDKSDYSCSEQFVNLDLDDKTNRKVVIENDQQEIAGFSFKSPKVESTSESRDASPYSSNNTRVNKSNSEDSSNFDINKPSVSLKLIKSGILITNTGEDELNMNGMGICVSGDNDETIEELFYFTDNKYLQSGKFLRISCTCDNEEASDEEALFDRHENTYSVDGLQKWLNQDNHVAHFSLNDSRGNIIISTRDNNNKEK